MSKVTLVQMVYNSMKYIPTSFNSMLAQTHKDTEIIAVINGNEDGSKEYIQSHYPSVTIIDPGENLKFVRGHNLVFSTVDTDFFQLVNDDLWLEPNYVEEMLKAFDDPRVGAANGKVYQYRFATHEKTKLLDSTGLTYSKSGRGRSRGQHELDNGQFDNIRDVVGVDGAACVYRKSALEAVKYPLRHPLPSASRRTPPGGDGKNEETFEYFDTDFEMYWEDVDLSLRLVNAGFMCKFVPTAIGHHGRTASSTPGGYKKVLAFITLHAKFSPWIRQFNYKNHLFLFIKNSPKWYLQFFIREFFYHCYTLVWEPRTFKILPTFFKQLPSIWKKRKWIHEHRKISTKDFERLLS